MRLLQLIGISYDFFCKRKWMRLFLSILCGFSLFLSAYAMLQILYGYSAIGGYADAISGDKGQILMITEDSIMDSPEMQERWSNFLRFLKNEVPSSGAFAEYLGGFPELEDNELYRAVNSRQQQIAVLREYPSASKIIIVDCGILSLGKLKLPFENGQSVPYEGDKKVMLVGTAYEEILSVGMTLTWNGEQYVVGGFLPKGGKWPSDQGITSPDQSCIPMDYCFLAFNQNLKTTTAFGYRSTFVLPDGKKEITRQRVWEIADAFKIGITVKTVDEYIQDSKALVRDSMREMINICLFTLFISSFLNIVSKLMNVMMQKRDYGILYAFGYTAGEIKLIVFFEEILFSIGSLIFCILNCRLFGRILSIPWTMQLRYIKTHFLWGMLGTLLLMEGVALAAIYVVLGRKKPVDLLKD